MGVVFLTLVPSRIIKYIDEDVLIWMYYSKALAMNSWFVRILWCIVLSEHGSNECVLRVEKKPQLVELV